jgi:tetratricopeptide (TPR) repeat protein
MNADSNTNHTDTTDATLAELLGAAQEAWIESGFCTADFDGAQRVAEAAYAAAVELDSRAGQALASLLLGYILHYRLITVLIAGGSLDTAAVPIEREHFSHALSLYEPLNDAVGVANALFGLGLVEQVLLDDWDAAMPYYRRAEALLPVLESAGDLYTRSEIHRHLGFYHLVVTEQPAEAVRELRTSLDLREQDGDARRIPSGLTALAWAERAAGEPGRAVDLLRRALTVAREAKLIPARIADTESELREAEAELAAQQHGQQ